MEKTYLGDAVYCKEHPYGGIVLTTEDGVDTTNTIVLEPKVIESLMRFVERMRG